MGRFARILANELVRASERNAKTRAREAERRRKEKEKQKRLRMSGRIVDRHLGRIDAFRSFHLEIRPGQDWHELASTPHPEKPNQRQTHEKSARSKLLNYRPSLLDRMLHRVERRTATLSEAVDRAKQQDSEEHRVALGEYENAVEEWRRNQELTEQVLRGEENAWLMVLSELGFSSRLAEAGTLQQLTVLKGKKLAVRFLLRRESLVPDTKKRVLKSGALSERPMSKRDRLSLLREHIHSVSVAIARDAFQAVPAESVIVTILSWAEEAEGECREPHPIFSAEFQPDDVSGSRINRWSPSELVTGLRHLEEFGVRKGFDQVDDLGRM